MNVALPLATALVLMAGGLIQSVAGFGFGLFALPLLLFLGRPLPEAVILVILASALQKTAGIARLRRDVPWSEMVPLMGVGLAMLFPGILLLRFVSGLGPRWVKMILGFCILVLLGLRRFRARGGRDGTARAWGYVAAGVSGLLNGFANIGGPPMVLWVLSRPWPGPRIRGSLFAFSMVFVPFQLIVMGVVFGNVIWQIVLEFLWLSPAVLLGTLAGLRLGNRVSLPGLRTVMQLMLIAVAMSAVVSPLL